MKSLYKLSSHLRYGVARAKKFDPRVFIKSVNIQRICRHAAEGNRMLALRPLLLSALALAVLWYLYGMIFSISQSRTSHQSTQEYTSLLRALESSKRTTAKLPIVPDQRNTDPSTVTLHLSRGVKNMTVCVIPPNLGPISANIQDMALEKVEKKYSEVRWGGWYLPPNCTARYKVAIIVPYRDRKINLAIFLNHMHPFLMEQKIEYGIFIVEQEGTHEFNRGKLLNVGFMESQKYRDWQCFIFHDIDMLPLDQRNLYYCPRPLHPRFLDISDVHGAYENSKKNMRSEGMYGGVSALTQKQFIRANGYSNGYWGWGGEDDDLYFRLTDLDYSISQYNRTIARYTMLKHRQHFRNPARFRVLLQTLKSFHKDGLNRLRYRLVSVKFHHLYTHIVVNIDQSYHDLQELLQEQYYLQFGSKRVQGKV